MFRYREVRSPGTRVYRKVVASLELSGFISKNNIISQNQNIKVLQIITKLYIHT